MSNDFLLHAVGSMSEVAPISYRRIFNGYGIYHRGVQFAIIVNDRLYFRADEHSRDLYIAKRMSAFLPASVTTTESNFFQLPEDVLSQPAELIYWMRIAVEAAQHNHSIDNQESGVDMLVRHTKLR
ncbi:MAG: TfoX family protein [Gammaproteobacteria bacterium]|nr:MAG: TfoX family protein [Gammaproteobacteria bacterium]